MEIFQPAVLAQSDSDNRHMTLPEEGLQEAGPAGIVGGFSRPGVTGQPLWDLF